MDSRGLIWVAVAVIVIIAVVAVVGSMAGRTGAAAASGGSGALAVLLTDPPQVPAGTTALTISYSSVQVHVSTAGTGQPNPAWVNASGSGTVNLLSLVNVSQTIATGSIPNRSTVDMVRFNVDGARITVNGTAYNVTVPGGAVTAHIGSGAMVNGSAGLLMQMNPTVAAIFTANQTVFVLVPSVKAIFVGSSQQSAQVGATRQLNSTELRDLEDAKPNITITAASLNVSGNSTMLSVTVKDSSNQSVVLKHLTIFGNLSAAVNTPAVAAAANSTVSQLLDRLKNESVCPNASAIASLHVRMGENDTVEVTNATANSSARGEVAVQDRPDIAGANINIGEGASANGSSGSHVQGANSTEAEHVNATESSNESSFHAHMFGDFATGMNASMCSAAALQAAAQRVQSSGDDFGEQITHLQQHLRMLPLLIAPNGSLAIASGEDSFANSTFGYNLSAGGSVTLRFTGAMLSAQGHMLIAPQVGKSYAIRVSGEEGTSSAINVTAG